MTERTTSPRVAPVLVRPAADRACCPSPMLVVLDPDLAVGTRLVEDLANDTLAVVAFDDAVDALLAMGAEPPHAVVVSDPCPGVAADRVVAAVRARWDVPVVVGIDPEDHDAATRAMAAGAGACIPRPYRGENVLALLRGVLDPTQVPQVHYGELVLDRCTHLATWRGAELDLSLREFELLEFLAQRQGRVASRHEISEAVWGGPTSTNTVVVHVRRLRAKLTQPGRPDPIVNIRGIGYRLDPDC